MEIIAKATKQQVQNPGRREPESFGRWFQYQVVGKMCKGERLFRLQVHKVCI